MKRIFIRVNTGRDNDNAQNNHDQMSSINRFSNEQNILINSVLATSPNSLDVSWETNDGMIPATSLTLHYRVVGSNEFQTATAMIDAKEYTINDLRAYSEYEVFASVPHGLSGSISNIRKGIKYCTKTDIFLIILILCRITNCFVIKFEKEKHWMDHHLGRRTIFVLVL